MMMSPRHERLNWDDHHMLLALVTAQKSPDPNTQVGVIVVDQENRILATGYNGAPRNIPVNMIPWDREHEDQKQTKYMYVLHAEVNAILNSNVPVVGGTLYTTLYPCHECMKIIVASGIKTVVYLSNKYAQTDSAIVATRMADITDLECRQYASSQHAKIALQSICDTVKSCEE